MSSKLSPGAINCPEGIKWNDHLKCTTALYKTEHWGVPRLGEFLNILPDLKSTKQVGGEGKLKNLPDKLLHYFGLFSWIASTHFLLTTLAAGQVW